MQQLCYSCSCAMWPAAQHSSCIIIPIGLLFETAYSLYHTDLHVPAAPCHTYCMAQCGATSHFGHISGCNDSNSTTSSCDNSNSAKGSSSICWCHTATMRAVCSRVVGLRWGHHQPAISWWCMPAHNSFSFVSSCSGFCVLCAAMHSLRCVLSQYISHHVIRDVSHATFILFLPDVGHVKAGPGYMLQCICVHML